MTKSAIVERIVVGLIVGYFALGANNEINLERADTVAASTPAVKTIYDGVEFASQHEASIYKLEAFRDGWFPWAGHIGMPMCYALVAAAVACYGGLAHEIFNVVFTDAVSRRRYLFGLFLGPLIYGVSSLGPYALIETNEVPTPRLSMLVAVCLVGGAFAEETWRFLGTLPGKLFNRNKE